MTYSAGIDVRVLEQIVDMLFVESDLRKPPSQLGEMQTASLHILGEKLGCADLFSSNQLHELRQLAAHFHQGGRLVDQYLSLYLENALSRQVVDVQQSEDQRRAAFIRREHSRPVVSDLCSLVSLQSWYHYLICLNLLTRK